MGSKKLKKWGWRTLKGIALLVGIFLIIGGFLYFRNTDYKMHSLFVNNVDLKTELSKGNLENVAKQLVSQMDFEEKVSQMYGENYGSGLTKLAINMLFNERFAHIYVGKNDRLGIPPWVLSDGPRGARVLDKDVNGVTTFPVGMARGASWNPELEYEIHKVISSEMRANKVNYGATPCINLLRHPGWGRAQETYGEDSWLLGEFGVAAVKGLEDNNIMACPKHFALNSIENSRWVVDVKVDERTLREVYLPHWKKTIQDGKPASIMSAYNSVNGEFCGENKYLLTDILRNDWGFEGFVSTDWLMGLYDGVKGVKAGLNVEMPFKQAYKPELLKEAIEKGEITETDIDKLVVESLRTRLKYALGENDNNYTHESIGKQSSLDLARKVAEESMVLLKNDGILPFQQKQGKTIAVIGRLADLENTGDHGSSDSTPIYVETPYEGIKKHHEKLGNTVVLNDGNDLNSAKELAKKADEVIMIVGFTHEDEGEYIILDREKMVESANNGKAPEGMIIGGDRTDLRLSNSDENLIEAIAPENKNLALVYVGGSAIDMTSWEDKVPTILFSWYSGMEGGTALANILYGKVSPSGKLPFTIAKDTKDYPYFTPYTKEIEYEYYHGYTLFDKKSIQPAYAFGFGMGYTNFVYDSLKVIQPKLSKSDVLQVEVNVTNKGNMTAKEVVQLYIGFNNSKIDRPVKLLRDFKKVTFAPMETKKIMLEVNVDDMAWYNPEAKAWQIEAMDYEVYVGSSSAERDLLKATFSVQEIMEETSK
ncbi:glycoside hydrolase family 3 C-terminal domain-containing protein [Flagellimonas sp. 389]|uniref:beta-glucosidase n=1 Tax=Flagellimonas sp. 389 TaxID=2835862 RepID=UPI001BD52903|nr:glycoside hydrolase family 3 C-terminal domain-containing protein [Flagellimonas sp. 389]MBS9461908.1 glycoside hydrolase family 3 C-terminal domain-containing protein [Flagellimonas sp. 389]